MIKRIFALFLCLSLNSYSIEPSASSTISATGVNTGYVVQLGSETGTFLTDIALTGKFHAFGLVTDNNTLINVRKKLLESGVIGVAQVNKGIVWNPLPFPSASVNLLVADLDLPALQSVTQNEIDRIVAPLGASYVKKGGTWTVKKKTMPSEMDQWTHYDRDPGNSAVSRDKLTGIANSVKWFGSNNQMAEWPRFSDGKIALKYSLSGTSQVLECRDAFNGVLLWNKQCKVGGLYNVYPFVFVNNKIYLPIEGEGKPISVIDANTGSELYKLDKGGLFTIKSGLNIAGGKIDYATSANMMMVVGGGKIIQSVRGKVYCLKESDGSFLWSRQLKDSVAAYPTLDTINNRLYIANGDWLGSGRDFHARVKSIYALNLNNGDSLWCNNNYGNTHLSQIIWNENKLVLFNHFTFDKGNFFRRKPGDAEFDRLMQDTLNSGKGFFAQVNPATGAIMWSRKPIMFMNTTSRCFVYDNKVWHISMHGIKMFKCDTGDTIPLSPIQNIALPWSPTSYEGLEIGVLDLSACSAPVIVDKHIYTGGCYINPIDWKYVPMLNNRSNCGTRLFPAYGAMYSTGNGCKCWKMWRGYLAHNSDPKAPEISDQQKLDNSTVAAQTQIYQNLLSLNTSSVYNDSRSSSSHPFYDTLSMSITLGDMRFTVWNNEGRIDAYNGSTLAWSFTSSGRIYSTPIELNGNIYFGSNDGYLYCLTKSNGTQKWRFLVGRNERKVLAFSQTESAWPVYGVTIKNNTVYASAGRNLESDHGIYIYGLNPQTGAVVSKLNYYLARSWANVKDIPGNNSIDKNRANFINGPLVSLDSLPDRLMIKFFDNAAGTSGKVEGDRGWQGFVFDPNVTGVINPTNGTPIPPDFEEPKVNVVYTPLSNQNKQFLNSQKIRLVSINGKTALRLSSKGIYNIHVVDAHGKTVMRKRVLSDGTKAIELDKASKSFYISVK